MKSIQQKYSGLGAWWRRNDYNHGQSKRFKATVITSGLNRVENLPRIPTFYEEILRTPSESEK